jgi:PAS domain S-box-containing protein
MRDQSLTGRERTFEPHEIIVTKTDPQGRITYANDVFLRLSGLTEREALGKPHSVIRHPEMPKCVFRLLWDTIRDGREIFAWVNNRAVNGDHYWVLAHVTPTFAPDGSIAGFHSNRRVPDRAFLRAKIEPLYAELRAIERAAPSAREGMDAAGARLAAVLSSLGLDYERFVFAHAA